MRLPMFEIMSDEQDGQGTWHIYDNWMRNTLCEKYFNKVVLYFPSPEAHAIRCAGCMEAFTL